MSFIFMSYGLDATHRHLSFDTSATSSKDDADSIPTYTINFHARLFHQFLCVLYRFFEC